MELLLLLLSLLLFRCCDGVVMLVMEIMVMVENDYLSMTKHAGNVFLVSVLLVSWWSLNCVSVVVILVALWCVRSVLTVFGDAVGACSFLGGVSVVSWRCSGVVSSRHLRNDSRLPCQYQIGVKGMERDTLHLGCMRG